MPKKSAKAGKPTTTYVNVYELVATFAGRDGRLVQHIEEKDRLRLLECLAEREGHGFYELGGHNGHECLVNTTHVVRLNVLGYLPGVQFEAEPDVGDDEAIRQLEKREADETPIILRIWLKGRAEPEIQDGIEYAAWCGTGGIRSPNGATHPRSRERGSVEAGHRRQQRRRPQPSLRALASAAPLKASRQIAKQLLMGKRQLIDEWQ